MIDYHKIQAAVMIYKSLGYRYIEVPWIVPVEDVKITSEESVLTGKQALIGSGEQGFLSIRKTLPPGQSFVCVTPCFRVEPTYVPGFIEPWFLKVELMIVEPKGDKKLLNDAKTFMSTYTRNLKLQPTEQGTDLFLNGYEVGSYGVRSHEGFSWAYGTGLAEPRFSSALQV